MKNLLFPIVISLLLFSCSENDEKADIVGEWKLTEIYNGYTNGGDFKWRSVPSKYSETLKFTSDGEYFTENGLGEQMCTGTYRYFRDNQLEINSSCQTKLVKYKIDLAPKTLIINYQVIEGIIREKYTLVGALNN